MTSVAIIGGYGGMGRLFARILKKNAFKVVITGPRPERGKAIARELGVAYESDNMKASEEADIVIITVPIKKTIEVIREVAPFMKKGSLLMDLTSIKKQPCEAMLEFSSSEVDIIGSHPVFGPTLDDLKEQNIVLCKVRGNKWFKEIKGLFEKEGAHVTVCTPEEHDEAMSVVQGMTHFMLISAGITMRDLKFNLKKSRAFSSPVYDLVLDLVGRILSQDPNLYAEIQIGNPKTKYIRNAYLKAAKDLDGILDMKNEDAFIREMKSAAEHFGDTSGAMARTNRILKK